MSNSTKSDLKREWLRPNDVRHVFGIGRSKLYQLIGAGLIRSKSLKEPGQRAGTRLINYDSIAEYIERLPA